MSPFHYIVIYIANILFIVAVSIIYFVCPQNLKRLNLNRLHQHILKFWLHSWIHSWIVFVEAKLLYQPARLSLTQSRVYPFNNSFSHDIKKKKKIINIWFRLWTIVYIYILPSYSSFWFDKMLLYYIEDFFNVRKAFSLLFGLEDSLFLYFLPSVTKNTPA